MSQTRSDWLSIDRISKLWAAETKQAGILPEDIAGDLVEAAEFGKFEHPVHSREDAPRGKLTYKETREDGTVETKETEQPGVGPYGSPLRMRDGRRVNSIDIANYIKTRETAPGTTDRETRRTVASEIFLSVEGLRRWCDEPGFAEWAQLRGLSRPKFIRSVASRTPPPPTTVGAETRCKEWLIGLMKAGPPKKRKPEYRTEAKALYDVGSRAFRRAWANAVAETGNNDWSRSGPKS